MALLLSNLPGPEAPAAGRSVRRRPKGRFLLPLLLAAALVAALAACGGSEAPASLEEQAQSIDRVLLCLQCPGETIDQSQVVLAVQMRAVVRERLAEGMTREEVIQFFVDRYGEEVLAAPPREGFNLIAWIVPIAAVALGAAAVALVVRSMRRSAEGAAAHSEEGLEEYLAVVDREMEDGQSVRRAPVREPGAGLESENG